MTPPGTYHQGGGRPVRQPKISGCTSRQCNIMEIITQSGTKSYKRFTRPSRHYKITCQAWPRTEFNWQRKTTKATAWSGSTPQASGWATDPSTLLLHVLAKVEDEFSTKPGHNHKAREYIIMHSASIVPHHKQSNNHATRYTLEIDS